MTGRYFMNRKKSFPAHDSGTLTNIITFIEDSLKTLKIDHKLMMRSVLAAEEMVAQMIETADPDTSVRVQVKRFFGDAEITISSIGDEIKPYSSNDSHIALNDVGDQEVQQAIRSIILKSQEDLLKISRRDRMNRVSITLDQSEKAVLIKTVVALILGIVAGILLRFVLPDSISSNCTTYALEPVKTMFMNALKIVVAPVVFLSIVSCVSQFKNLSELGRIGIKVMGMYLLTTIMAILIAVGFTKLIDPGTKGFAKEVFQQSQTVTDMSDDLNSSLLNTIVNIVPDNVVKPFENSDTLQIIFLAVLFGIAIGMVGEYSMPLQNGVEALNSLFVKVTSLIVRFMPAGIFCSIALMVIKLELDSAVSILQMAGTHVLCIFSILVVYGLLLLVVGRLNPLTFYKKNREGMITSFMLSSSSAAMPINLRTCTEKLGVSPKVASFSIPLGATVNMDGTSIILTVGSIFLAKAYGVEVSGGMLLTMLVTIVLLALGAPGVPGSGIVCFGIVLSGLGVPIEIVGLILGIYPFIDMLNTVSNTTGDVAVTTIVAKSEGLLDLKKYNSK